MKSSRLRKKLNVFQLFPLTRSVHTLSLHYFTHVNPVKCTLLTSVKLRELEMVKSTLEVGNRNASGHNESQCAKSTFL